MSQYLQFRCGPFRLLVALARVVEVNDVAGTESGALRAWREQVLPVVDLAAFLGQPRAGRGQQLVLGQDGDRHLLLVEHVDGLVDLPDGRFAGLAELAPALAALVDGVAVGGADEGCLLRLRHPFPWLAALAHPMSEVSA